MLLYRLAYMQNNPGVALRWLEEAVVQATADGNRTIKESQVQQVMKQVREFFHINYDLTFKNASHFPGQPQ